MYTEEFVFDPYSRNAAANLWIVDLASGETRKLDDIDAAGPSWSPNGDRIAFWTHLETVQGQRDIWTIAAAGGPPTPVLIDGHTDWDPVWSADGQALYFLSDRGGTPDLWRIEVDERSGAVHGAPRPVTSGTTSLVQVSAVRDGRVAAVAQTRQGAILRADFDPDTERVAGPMQTLHTSNFPFWQMGLSPDERWLTYGTMAPRERLYMMSVDGRERRKLVDDEHRNRGLTIAPGGKWATFYSNRSGVYNLWAVRTDATGLRMVVDSPRGDLNDPFWTADGRLFAALYSSQAATVEIEVPATGLDDAGTPLQMRDLPGTEGFAGTEWSPDGRQLIGFNRPDYRLAVYTAADQSVQTLARDGMPVFMADKAAWIDDGRMLFWDVLRAEAVVYDFDRRQYRTVPDLPGPSGFRLTSDRRTLYIKSTQEESDVWLLELGQARAR